MPTVNNPVAIRFCNERVRVAADILCRGSNAARAILAEWQAKGIASLIPDDPLYTIEDGAPADGRQPITGADVHRVLEALQMLVSALDGSASNGQSHYTNALKVAVNPTPRMGVEL